MYELKTKLNDSNVADFLNAIENEEQKNDSFKIVELMRRVTNSEPKMWGNSIIGFGIYKYKYKSGREGEWFLTGFSPRKKEISLYIMSGFSNYNEILGKLGKIKTGKSCLYIKRLNDIDQNKLEKLIKLSVESLASK